MASGKIMTLKAAILAVLAGATGSGLLVADAAAKVSRRDDDGEVAPPLLLAPPRADAGELLAHRSHSSHRSHQSHRSHSSGGRASHYSAPSYSAPSHSAPSYSAPSHSGTSHSGKSHSGISSGSVAKPAKPVPQKPARVSLVALPGGSIFIDGKLAGRDETPKLTLKVGRHTVKVENRFLGTHEYVITVSQGQSGRVKVEW